MGNDIKSKHWVVSHTFLWASRYDFDDRKMWRLNLFTIMFDVIVYKEPFGIEVNHGR